MSRFLVIGLGRSGRSAAALLSRQGNDVVAIDSGEADVADLVAAGVDVRTGFAGAVDGVDVVVKSPGVPRGNAALEAALAAGAEVWSEVELAARHLPNPMLAVTGTNGKTTTTELTAHMLRHAGLEAVACGNQGLPVTDLVGATSADAWLVVECSSFQLEDVHAFHPRCAALLNVTPDHLDRHGSMPAYLDAKLRVFQNLEAGDLAIAPGDVDVPGGAPHRVVGEAREQRSVAWAADGLHLDGRGRVCGWDDVPLRGAHNRQNMMVAAALVAHAGVTTPDIASGLASFPGVPHRLEVVATVRGVTYVNDSKATNPDAAVAALDAYPQRVHLIAGGSDKGTSFAPMAAAGGGVVRAYLIGATAEAIAADMRAAGVAVDMCGTLDTAVTRASRAAQAGDVVLLAPGCASYDQFTGFEHRGEEFRALVHEVTRTV